MNSRYTDIDPKTIADDKDITYAARARLAYLRLVIHLNQLEHERRAIYKYAFGSLIIVKDRALWGNNATLAKDITAD
ncbi:hypothetical protein H4Q26_013716 [Puccinia striiformis f. sp. tritici PST-130]|nr:hypothetical protein H4Q26_013716 [Puccinia striiformis f. sp. tritici PST-130]